MNRIVEILGFVMQGMTEPVLCRAEDGHDYVVKGHYAGHRALIAEWVANRLGTLLGLPIPDFELLQLDPDLLRYSVNTREVGHLGRGTLFGSRRELNVVEIRQADFPWIDQNLMAQVLVFDWWVANPDRVFMEGSGNPNLLWCDQQERLVVMDHNLAFTPALMANFWTEHAFRHARREWSPAFRLAMSEKLRRALAQLSTIWAELPEDWTEVAGELTLTKIEALLWKFDREADKCWSPT